MPLYEMKCPKCNKEFDVRLSISEYETSAIECEDCLLELERHFRSAPQVNIPWQHQASPGHRKEQSRIPINIIDEKPGGGYRVTRIGNKKDINNE